MLNIPIYDALEPHVPCQGAGPTNRIGFAKQAHAPAILEWFHGYIMGTMNLKRGFTIPIWCQGCFEAFFAGHEDGRTIYQEEFLAQGGRFQ